METKLRSFLKAFTYRFSGLFGTLFLVWIVTGELNLAAMVSVADTLIKIAAFYVHERVWHKIPYGKEHIEYQI